MRRVPLVLIMALFVTYNVASADTYLNWWLVKEMYVNAPSGLNVRAGPGAQHDILAVLHCGTIVYPITHQGEWVLVSLTKQKTKLRAWVVGAYLVYNKVECPELTECNECVGHAASAAGVFGSNMCSSCLDKLSSAIAEKLEHIEPE